MEQQGRMRIEKRILNFISVSQFMFSASGVRPNYLQLSTLLNVKRFILVADDFQI